MIIFIVCVILTLQTDNAIVAAVSAFAGVAAMLIMLAPVQGFHEPECVIEVELLVLQEETEGIYYLKDDESAIIYAYDNSGKYGLEGTAYDEAHIDKNYYNIKIYQSLDFTKPVLKKFVKKQKGDFFVLHLFQMRKSMYSICLKIRF